MTVEPDPGAPPPPAESSAPTTEQITPGADEDGTSSQEETREFAPPTPTARPTLSPLRLAQIGAIAVAALIGVSVVWAGAYRFVNPPGTFNMAARAAHGVAVRQRWTPLARMSPHLVRAVIGGEDSRFCSHDGFDVEAIEAAAAHNKVSKHRRGASTLTQQTAKNAFLWNGGGWARKGVETWFAVLVDALWSKRRVMEVYLNLAEWGDGNFGAEAAARARFHKSARDLTPREAALLAAVLPSPNKWRVDPPGPYVRRRAAVILRRMEIVRRDGLDACIELTHH